MREPTKIVYDKWTLGEALDLTVSASPSAWAPSLPIGKDEEQHDILLAPNDYVKDVLRNRYGNRMFLAAEDLTDAQLVSYISNLWSKWWDTREEAFAFLADAFLREYNPIENYDRYEEGSIVDEHDIGARSGTDNLTDTYAATQKTTTETPGVTETLEDTYGATQKTTTETPGVTETLEDTYGATQKTTTETPGVTETLEDTFGATQKTTTETPRAETTVTTTPGVIMTTEKDIYGDNSSTAVPVEKTTVTPDATDADVVVTAGTDGQNTTVEADLQRIDTHEKSYEGFNQTIEADLQKIDTHEKSFEGFNTTVEADLQRIDTHETSFEGFNQTVEAELQHIDTHNRSTGQLATKDTDTRTWDGYHVHGNIGTMTVSSMLLSEVQLRSGTDLVEMAIREFVDRYTFYAE